ncbi:MAG TPA: DNA polymerase III subunit chi [Rhodanobacteraceae bacterium]|nr:DNA polymerase III subunit chi [Rhodanobacteraceae bacterium]
MRADFYLLEKSRFSEQPLLLVCELTRKALAAGQPTLILARDAGEAQALDDLLWSFDAEAFIPHRIAGLEGGIDDDDDADVEVLIATPELDLPPRPLMVNLRPEPVTADCDRVLEIVPADNDARAGSRERWRAYRERGVEVHAHEM